MENEDWKNKPGLVWRGKIIEDMKTQCEYGDFICEFGCSYFTFRLRVCSRLFIESGNKVDDEVSIPMVLYMQGSGIYNTAIDNTPLSSVIDISRSTGNLILSEE
jgi:hypothetical protein